MLLLESITMSLQFRPHIIRPKCGRFRSIKEFGAANHVPPRNRASRQCKRIDNSFLRRTSKLRRTIRTRVKRLGSGSDHVGDNRKSGYHPFEDILISDDAGAEDHQLTAAETSRTLVEVNSGAILILSELAGNGVLRNIFSTELPYLTDEHGDIYFQVNVKDDMIMEPPTPGDNYVKVILGVLTNEMMVRRMSDDDFIDPSLVLGGSRHFDSDFDEEDEDIDDNGVVDLGGGWVQILEEDEDEDVDEDEDDDDDIDDDDDDDDYDDDDDDEDDDDDDEDSDDSLGDWAQLETMRSSHPMYFARRIAQAQDASDNPIDYIKQPQNALFIEGLIRLALVEEQSVIQLQRPIDEADESEGTSECKDDNPEDDKVPDSVQVNGHANESFSSEVNDSAEDIEKDKVLDSGKTFFKVEMTKIELMLASGHQINVDLEAYRNARPDAIAHSASKIISRVNAAGEKTTHALKSLCWRCKGIQVEDASLIGVDTLGFDLKVCSGTQILTLRFAFNSRATSEYSAERQLNDLLFPRSNQKLQKVKQSSEKES